jgi:Flp pilus assembly protein TadB
MKKLLTKFKFLLAKLRGSKNNAPLQENPTAVTAASEQEVDSKLDTTTFAQKNLETAADRLARANHVQTEWAYRHTMFWSAFTRWATAVVVVNFTPILEPELWKRTSEMWLVIPITVFFLTIFGTAHMIAETARLRKVQELLDSLREPLNLIPRRLSEGSRMEKQLAKKFLRIDLIIICGFGVLGIGLTMSWILLSGSTSHTNDSAPTLSIQSLYTELLVFP